MADWATHSVRDVITQIKDGEIVLPVIQRHLVWDDDKMELLFDSLFRKNSFGSIICIEEERGKKPLFAHRLFTSDGTNEPSSYPESLDRRLYFVVDGQQRLQSFYTGLCGKYSGKTLYYDLFSDCRNSEYGFKFAYSEDRLPKSNAERSILGGRCLWYSAPSLFEQLKSMEDTRSVADRIASEKRITSHDETGQIWEAVEDFYRRIFRDESIGLSKVVAHLSGDDIDRDRRRIAEMFRRLNDGGTKLSQYDLVAMKLKSFDDRMETFLDEITGKNEDIGFDQDTLVKLLLILRDKPDKGMLDMKKDDAEFAVNNFERIQITLDVLKKFLRASNHYEWFSSANKSAIPLYILAYHIFYHNGGNNSLQCLFDSFDRDKSFYSMLSWLKLSLLNQIFKRGCGWSPETTGLKMLHGIMKKNHGKKFPSDEIFTLYKRRLHNFIDADSITPGNLDSLSQEYTFYLIYGGVRSAIRFEDKDHIQPSSLLERDGVKHQKIDDIGNLMLIDRKSNRVDKNDKELSVWLENIDSRNEFIARHLIPANSALWTIDKFSSFLRARQKLIVRKIKSDLQ